MQERAWMRLPRATIPLAAAACLGLSTQILFQRAIYVDYGLADIAVSWLVSLRDFGVIVASILGALLLAGRLPVRGRAAKFALFAGTVLAAAAFGEWLASWMQWGAPPPDAVGAAANRAWRWLPICALGLVILLERGRAERTDRQLHENEVVRLQLAQQQTVVSMQIMQSQIEPHFLFNTLATIRRLHQIDPARGRETLSHFIHYLRSALPEMRQRETTLGRELQLIGAYLDVLRVRMGERLAYEIDVPASLHDARIPPLSLATLVENAIKHGLEPLPEGGRLRIAATLDEQWLKVSVDDTGPGLTASDGSGMGLANLHVRLRGLYGPSASLQLAPNRPRGLSATLCIPRAPSTIADLG